MHLRHMHVDTYMFDALGTTVNGLITVTSRYGLSKHRVQSWQHIFPVRGVRMCRN
ncbi:hypothetical protein PAXRUDRAFT_833047 [Paxillus rubicundulus Ve08.2h10]|uniref:Uncharacterized protein n=1 Tax=Paxillus rubicundulus Ve08.2h10 TaxID=930991 RepID=A0A0D0DI21_9AGAM|nr:hypothetical protein PAXRUDRAFT_833047 [Paxillus rubicundulus Ve08.2h10]